MDNPNYNQPLFGIHINENLRIQLRGAAVVAGLAAIISFANAILKVVGVFVIKRTVIESRYEGINETTTSLQRGGTIFSAIISLAISFLLFWFLNRFSSHTKAGLDKNNSDTVSSGLGGLANYSITLGVLLIIVLAFCLLALVGMLAGSAR